MAVDKPRAVGVDEAGRLGLRPSASHRHHGRNRKRAELAPNTAAVSALLRQLHSLATLCGIKSPSAGRCQIRASAPAFGNKVSRENR